MLGEEKQKIDVRTALKAFDLIRQHGDKNEDGSFTLYGVTGSSDFDGYNLLLQDARVKLHIFFHNRFECQYDSGSALDQFIDKLEQIIAHYESS